MSDTELLLLVEARKKSRFVAILLNLFIPGTGYMYCGRWLVGILALWIVVALWWSYGWILAIPLTLILVIDAALCVGRYNRNMTESLIKARSQSKPGTTDSSSQSDLVDLMSNRSISGWKKAVMYIGGALSAVFLVAAAGLFVEKADKAQKAAMQTPHCDADEVKEWVVSDLNVEIESSLSMLGAEYAAPVNHIFEIVEPKELFLDGTSSFRVCIAKTRHNNGYGVTGYYVEWGDKNSGYWQVKLANYATLMTNYGEGKGYE